MRKSPDKRVSRTKKDLKNALLTLLKEKKLKDITITEIVKLAEYNRGTFYIHYEQKEDLLEEMIQDVLEDLSNSFRKPYQDVNREVQVQIDKLSTICIFTHFLKHKEFYQVMLRPHIEINFLDKMVQTLEKHFREDINFFSDESESTIDSNLFYQYRVHGMIGLILEWIKSDFQHSEEYMADQIVKIVTFQTEKVYVNLSERENRPL